MIVGTAIPFKYILVQNDLRPLWLVIKSYFLNTSGSLLLERATFFSNSTSSWNYKDAEGFAKIMTNKDVLDNNGNLSLQLYVKQVVIESEHSTDDLISNIKGGQMKINSSIETLFIQLKTIGIEL